MTPEEFRSWRKARGLTQTTVGMALDRSLGTIARWEGGSQPIPGWLRTWTVGWDIENQRKPPRNR